MQVDFATLRDAGGWVVLAAVLIVGAGAFWRAAKAGDIVFGPTHRREIERGDRAEQTAAASAVRIYRLNRRIAELERELDRRVANR